MIRRLNSDDVSTEIRPQQQAQSLNDIGSLRLPSREAELGELLVWLEHDEVGAEHHASRLLLVVVDLDGSIVGDSECDDLRLVTLYTGSWTSCRVR